MYNGYLIDVGGAIISVILQVSSHTGIGRTLPRSGSTIRSWILERFAQAKIVILKNLEGANVVHFSFDLWSSPNHRAFLGVVAHWVDSAGTLHGLLVGLRRFRGAVTNMEDTSVQDRVMWTLP